jgi:rubrerythrin
MQDQIRELLNIAMDRELVSQAVYQAGQKKTEDRGAIALMKELAEQEQRHFQWLRDFSQGKMVQAAVRSGNILDLKIGEQLLDTPISEGASLQDVLTTAIKREEASIDFYVGIRKALEGPEVKTLCDRLLQEEKKHKLRVEAIYDDLFNQEN